MTVTRFGRILALARAIPGTFFGHVFDMGPKGDPRVPQAQGLPKEVPGGDFGVRGEYLRWV